MNDKLVLVAGSSNQELAKEISRYLNIPLCNSEIGRFPDGEIDVYIEDNVRGTDVFIIQSTSPPVNDHLMELLIIIDALKRASARRVTAVMPYYGYGRQDKKEVGRVPITAKLVANLITTAGADRVLTMDLHAEQIQGFFDIPLDNLRAAPLLADYFKHQALVEVEEGVIVSPDVGGVKRARVVAELLNIPLAIVEKRRLTGEEVEALNVIGDVAGKRAIIVDDGIYTGGTLLRAAGALFERGTKEVYVAATHGVFARNAIQLLENSPLKRVVVTNSIAAQEHEGTKVERISVGWLFAEAIKRIHQDLSVSELFSQLAKEKISKEILIR